MSRRMNYAPVGEVLDEGTVKNRRLERWTNKRKTNELTPAERS